jgi:hypothetical protein
MTQCSSILGRLIYTLTVAADQVTGLPFTCLIQNKWIKRMPDCSVNLPGPQRTHNIPAGANEVFLLCKLTKVRILLQSFAAPVDPS